MQIVNESIRFGKKYVRVSRSSMRFMKKNAHHRVRAALRSALAKNDWDLAENSTVGIRPLTSWDIS